MKLYSYLGKTQSLPAHARELGIPSTTLRSRIAKGGESIEEAFSRPAEQKHRPVPNDRPRPIPEAPKLERRGDGRACTRWMEGTQRRTAYFGLFDTVEANTAYARWCAEWYANQGRPAPAPGESVSVAGLIRRFLDWAERYYRKRGKITSEVHGFRSVLALVNELYGNRPAAEFTTRNLKAVQAKLVELGKAMPTVNAYTNKVCRCFSWGVSEGVIPAAVADALKHVRPLARGRSEAPSPDKIAAVSDADFLAAIPHLHAKPDRQETVALMVRVQRLTGMRPAEVCTLQLEFIDRTRTPWLYQPPDSKTQHLEKDRRVWIGPQARELLTPLLKTTKPGSPVFRLKRRGKGEPARVRVEFLRSCIANACKKAKVPLFKPNQIRHLRANDVHAKYEDDKAVAASLGNSPEVARQVYIDRPADPVAMRIAETLG